VRNSRELPPDLSDEAFLVSDAEAAGVTPSQLRSARLSTPFHGVRTVQQVVSTEERCAAYAPRLTAEQFFSHITAAELYGFPLPRDLRDGPTLHVAVIPPAFPPRARGISGHRLTEAAPPWTKGGLRAQPPADVWSHLGPFLSHDELVMVGDHLVRRKRPLCTLAQLRDAVESGRGVPGIVDVRASLSDVRVGTDSPRETKLRLVIIRAGLPEPVIGHTVINSDGQFVGTPDLSYVEEQIAIEYEGEHHRTDPRTYEDDIIRRELFEDAGRLVIRVTKAHLAGQHHWLTQRIARALAERSGRRPGQ